MCRIIFGNQEHSQNTKYNLSCVTEQSYTLKYSELILIMGSFRLVICGHFNVEMLHIIPLNGSIDSLHL